MIREENKVDIFSVIKEILSNFAVPYEKHGATKPIAKKLLGACDLISSAIENIDNKDLIEINAASKTLLTNREKLIIALDIFVGNNPEAQAYFDKECETHQQKKLNTILTGV